MRLFPTREAASDRNASRLEWLAQVDRSSRVTGASFVARAAIRPPDEYESAVSSSVLVATSHRSTIAAAMCSSHCDEGNELRALLRAARGHRRQAEIAAAAKVSTGLYKRLESGRLQTSRLATLMRIADALSLSGEQRVHLIALARPDLARMIERERAVAGILMSSVRRLAIRFGQVQGRSAALRTAVEWIHSSFALDGMSFVFELHGSREMRAGFSVGAELWTRAFPAESLGAAPTFGPDITRRTVGGVQTLCVGIREGENVLVVLGFASTSDRELDPKYAAMLETIAAVLGVRLSGRAVTIRS